MRGVARSARRTGADPAPDPRLLQHLVCPQTGVALRFDPAAQELIADEAGLAYPVRDGVPILLTREARPSGPR